MKNTGFTLVELVVVIMIILIISFFAVPGILNYQEFQNEEQYINQVINKLREYQIISLTKDITTKIDVDSRNLMFCEGTKCENLSYSKNLFLNLPGGGYTLNFNQFGDVLSSGTILTDDILLSSPNFRIRINTYGGIFKETK